MIKPYGVFATVSNLPLGPDGPFPHCTPEQMELWKKSQEAQHRFEVAFPNVSQELIREHETTRMAYRNSFQPLLNAMNEANPGIIRSESSDLVVVERRKDGRLKIWITIPRDLSSAAKSYGIPEDDPVLVRVIEAWNKRQRGEITANEWRIALMEYAKKINEIEMERRRSGL